MHSAARTWATPRSTLDLFYAKVQTQKTISYNKYGQNILYTPVPMSRDIKKILSKIEFIFTKKEGVFTKKIVFTGIKNKPKKGVYAPKQIFICDANGDNLKQITSGNSIHLSPSWEPGEKSILFTSFTRGNPDLYRIELDSFKVTSLSKHDGINSGGVFNPKASHIVFTGSDKKRNFYIWYKYTYCFLLQKIFYCYPKKNFLLLQI